MQRRGHDQRVALQRSVGRNDINGLRAQLQRAVEGGELPGRIKVLVVALEVDGPAACVGLQQGHPAVRGGAGERGSRRREFGAGLLHFGVDRNRCAVGAQQGAVILLLAVQRTAPLPIQHGVRAVPDCLPGHLAGLTRIECAIHRPPVDVGWLSLHQPEVALLVAAHQVVLDCLVEPLVVAVGNVFVPGRDVQRAMHVVVIEPTVPVHGVGRNELSRVGVLPDGLYLVVDITRPGVADKALPVQQQTWILVLRVHGHLIEVVVGLAPIGRGPVSVELGDAVVLLLQPVVELLLGCRVEGGRPDLIVDLPAQHIGVVSVMGRQYLGDAMGERPVTRAGEGELLALAMLVGSAVLVDPQDLGVFIGEPRGWRGRRGADDDIDMVARGGFDGVVEPFELELTLARLERAPGEFGHAHHVDVGGFHQREVLFPALPGPLFRVPGCAQIKRCGR